MNVLNIDKTLDVTRNISDYVTVKPGGKSVLLEVRNGVNGSKVFDLIDLVMKDHYNLIHSKVYTTGDEAYSVNGGKLMGLGDRVSEDLFLQDGVWSMWNKGTDVGTELDSGKLPGKNIYGSQPFYMAKAANGNWFGVYTNVAQAQEWHIKNNKKSADV